jgi:hypothetical protein
MSGDPFCAHFNRLSPTATIFLLPDAADSAFIQFLIRPDGAGLKSIGNPIED